MIRSNVDLPQPDGPTIVTTSRSRIPSETSVNAAKPLKARLMCSMRIVDMPLQKCYSAPKPRCQTECKPKAWRSPGDPFRTQNLPRSHVRQQPAVPPQAGATVSESLHDDTRHVIRCNGDQKLIFSDKLIDDCANDRFDFALRFFDVAIFLVCRSIETSASENFVTNNAQREPKLLSWRSDVKTYSAIRECA